MLILDQCVVKELHLSLDVDFDRKVLAGRADLKVERVTPNIKELVTNF